MTAFSTDDDLLAAELAFGLIDDADRHLAEQRLVEDPAFAQAHQRWQAHAAALFADPGEAPRPSTWTAIVSRLPANDITSPRSRASLRWWQTGTVAATAAALILGAVALRAPTRIFVRVPVAEAPAAPMVAVLTGAKGLVTISFDPASGRMTSVASGLDIGHHSPELWAIPRDGKPRMMGIMNSSAPGWAKVPADARAILSAGVTIAVSVEPLGGSPSGLPTGPVILSGEMVAV